MGSNNDDNKKPHLSSEKRETSTGWKSFIPFDAEPHHEAVNAPKMIKRITEGGRQAAKETPKMIRRMTSGGGKDTKGEEEALPFAQVQTVIHQGCKGLVDATNTLLASLQSTSDGIRKPVANVATQADQEGTKVLTNCRAAYNRRYEFGPYIVASATLGVGGSTALRRGRLPGLMLGVLAGGIAYASVYDPTIDTPVFEWPFKNATTTEKKE